jgi:hypothetical protein
MRNSFTADVTVDGAFSGDSYVGDFTADKDFGERQGFWIMAASVQMQLAQGVRDRLASQPVLRPVPQVSRFFLYFTLV